MAPAFVAVDYMDGGYIASEWYDCDAVVQLEDRSIGLGRIGQPSRATAAVWNSVVEHRWPDLLHCLE